ncbi:hypothetical protein CAter282_2672 [Collimonas arenae]|uniref:Uncharacterized protein n=1 Tax=Collimonas arenae TaxID=279058 RepID=A0A127QK55_9BURK|nr:hypothetical protein [Collimonas arenae]AMP00522.1 hypothetical protein CAter10_2945 [Collimonas arenae]AMP10403.1 hypothetical protein CAter282_2672 [Collimonas arenae]
MQVRYQAALRPDKPVIISEQNCFVPNGIPGISKNFSLIVRQELAAVRRQFVAAIDMRIPAAVFTTQ